MRNKILVCLMGSLTLVTGCSLLPQTTGEMRSGYTYVPIDPFSVNVTSTTPTNPVAVPSAGTNLLESLPDNAVRIAVQQFDASGNVTYGPAGVSVKGSNYKVTVDYINADTANVKLWVVRSVRVARAKTTLQQMGFQRFSGEEPRLLTIGEPLPFRTIRGSEHYYVRRVDGETNELPVIPGITNVEVGKYAAEFNIPVYIGIGLRVTADISSYAGNVNMSGLGSIGAAAEARKLSGSLVVQTLGVNGKSIAAALPIQSELNQTTVQNAIVSVGAIKSNLYESETVVVPRLVGLYLPFPGGKPLVNAIISELSKEPVPWKRIAKYR